MWNPKINESRLSTYYQEGASHVQQQSLQRVAVIDRRLRHEMVKSKLLCGRENIRANEENQRRTTQMFMLKSGLTRAGIQQLP